VSDSPRDLSATAFVRDGDGWVGERGPLEARLASDGLASLIGKPQCAASTPCPDRFGIAVADIAQEAPAPPLAAKRPPPGKPAPQAPNPGKKSAESEREYMKRLNKDLDTLLGK
jgi:hypothetical protein